MNSSLYNFEGGPFHVAAEAEGTLPGQERPHQMLPASRGTAKKKENLLTSNSLKVQAHLVVMSYSYVLVWMACQGRLLLSFHQIEGANGTCCESKTR